MTRARSDHLWRLSIFAAITVIYWPAVSGQGSFFERDVWLYWIPHIEWMMRTLAAGSLPEWNAFRAFGVPFMSDPSTQFFYPPSIVRWLAPPRVSYTLLVVGHSLLGGLGTYSLLRPRLRVPAAAALGAVVFIGGGPLASSANLWHHFCSAAYLPWVVDAFLRLRRPGLKGAARLGALTGLQALAGSADVCLMTGFALVFLLPRHRRGIVALAPRLGLAVLLCGLIASVQWLPTALQLKGTARGIADPQSRLAWSVAPVTLIDLLLPLKGTVHAHPGEPDFGEMHARFIPWMYLGASTLPVLLAGARRSPWLLMPLILALLGSLGRYLPFIDVVARLPLISSFRFPSKLLWLVTGCWAGLAAIGAAALTRQKSVRPWVAGVGAAVLLMGIILAMSNLAAPSDSVNWRAIADSVPWAPAALGFALLAASIGRSGVPFLVAVVVVDLVGPAFGYNAYASPAMFATRPSIVDDLQRLGATRVHVVLQSRVPETRWRVPPGWTEEEAYYFGEGQFLLPPQGMRWSIRGSFDGDFSGLGSQIYSRFCSSVINEERADEKWLRLAGVTHVVRFASSGLPELPLAATVRTFHERAVWVLSVPDPLPLVYIVGNVRRVDSIDHAIAVLKQAEFDPRQEVVRVGDAGRRSAGGAGSVTSIVERPDASLGISADLTAPGTLVVLNENTSGWGATVDGAPASIHTANGLFQSVDLPAGRHHVELRYRTPGLRLGFGLSLLGWCLAALLFLPRTRAKPVLRAFL